MTGITGATGVTGNTGPSFNNYLFAYATGTQAAAVPNTYQFVQFNSVPLHSNWTPLGNTGAYTGFLPSTTGTFLISYSANFERTARAGATADFRVLLNNTEILGSQSSVAAATNNLPTRGNNVFTVNLTAAQIIAYQFAASATSGELVSDGDSNAGVPIAKQQTAFTTTITRIN